MIQEHCTIPIRIDHLPTNTRLEAAEWCLFEFGLDHVEIMRPLTVKVEGPNPCNEIAMVACFWFESQRDANWFALRWL
jgi:hypothetical protein